MEGIKNPAFPSIIFNANNPSGDSTISKPAFSCLEKRLAIGELGIFGAHVAIGLASQNLIENTFYREPNFDVCKGL